MSDTNTSHSQDQRRLTLDERILAIEAELPFKSMPGTTLSRCFAEKQGVEWTLALGPIQMPKTFFRGPTIEDVVTQGEKAVAEMKARGMSSLRTPLDELHETLTVGRSPRRRKAAGASAVLDAADATSTLGQTPGDTARKPS